jgi:hypothetical protein
MDRSHSGLDRFFSSEITRPARFSSTGNQKDLSHSHASTECGGNGACKPRSAPAAPRIEDQVAVFVAPQEIAGGVHLHDTRLPVRVHRHMLPSRNPHLQRAHMLIFD